MKNISVNLYPLSLLSICLLLISSLAYCCWTRFTNGKILPFRFTNKNICKKLANSCKHYPRIVFVTFSNTHTHPPCILPITVLFYHSKWENLSNLILWEVSITKDFCYNLANYLLALVPTPLSSLHFSSF